MIGIGNTVLVGEGKSREWTMFRIFYINNYSKNLIFMNENEIQTVEMLDYSRKV